MTDEAAGHRGPVSRVRLELAPRTVRALLLVAVGLWPLVRLRPVVLAVVVPVAMSAYEELESRVIMPRVYGRALRLPSSVDLFALPVAATVRTLVAELRVALPGEREGPGDTSLREGDDRAEEEYERRTHGVGAQQAAGIAAEISRDRRTADERPPEPLERPGPAAFAD